MHLYDAHDGGFRLASGQQSGAGFDDPQHACDSMVAGVFLFPEGAMIHTALEDVRAVKRDDPAAHGWLEIVLCHTPLHAILVYRLAHWIRERMGLRLIARLLSVAARSSGPESRSTQEPESAEGSSSTGEPGGLVARGPTGRRRLSPWAAVRVPALLDWRPTRKQGTCVDPA